MTLFPFVAVFAATCFLWSYGIQKRRWWAWYAGWVFGGCVAIAICYLAWIGLAFAASPAQRLVNVMLPGGAMCGWIFWARWWARNRGEFIRTRNANADHRDTRPAD